MTDSQIIAIAIVFVAALGSVLYNNNRLTDLRDTMNSRFNDVNRHIDDKFSLLMERLAPSVTLHHSQKTFQAWSYAISVFRLLLPFIHTSHTRATAGDRLRRQIAGAAVTSAQIPPCTAGSDRLFRYSKTSKHDE
jgi:hypothetical protein